MFFYLNHMTGAASAQVKRPRWCRMVLKAMDQQGVPRPGTASFVSQNLPEGSKRPVPGADILRLIKEVKNTITIEKQKRLRV